MGCEAVYLEGVVTVHCDAALPAKDAYKELANPMKPLVKIPTEMATMTLMKHLQYTTIPMKIDSGMDTTSMSPRAIAKFKVSISVN